MINAVIIFNNGGKPRLMRFYDDTSIDKQQEILHKLHASISKRKDNECNFMAGFSPDQKVIYKHFATLYFCFLIDSGESELAILDLIQSFVEALDRRFENVCELDLIFNFDKVHSVLDDFIAAGIVINTR